jgi:hypothetical protein
MTWYDGAVVPLDVLNVILWKTYGMGVMPDYGRGMSLCEESWAYLRDWRDGWDGVNVEEAGAIYQSEDDYSDDDDSDISDDSMYHRSTYGWYCDDDDSRYED